MKKQRKEYIESCEVSEVVTLNLGGYPQKVLFDGKRKNLPVVLCLHGGPGSPIPFSVGTRGLFPEWTDRVIMVSWDQLGCGANNFPLDNTFTVESFVLMTLDLIAEIKKLFPENKLILLGISWGSVLALHAACRVPNLLDGVLIYGQVLYELFYSEEVFSELEKNAPDKIKRRVTEIKCAGHLEGKQLRKNLGELTKYIRTYTDGYQNRAGKNAEIGGVIKGLLSSPDYSLKDFMAIVKNGYRKNESLWRELLHADYRRLLASVTVPYTVIQGDTDIVASTATVKRTVDESKNNCIRLKIVEKSGHIPSEQGMEAVFGELFRMAEQS